MFLDTSLKNFNFQYKFDHSGQTSYTFEEKEKIIKEYIESLSGSIYSIDYIPSDQKMMEVENKVQEEWKSEYEVLILRALVYNLFLFGTLKWCQYIFFKGDESEKKFFCFKSKQTITSGYLSSALCDDISDFASKNNIRNNLEKFLGNHKVVLADNNQRKYLFGKGHMVLKGDDKIKCRHDLGNLFVLVQQSKKNFSEKGLFEVIDVNLSLFKFFKFNKTQ